MKERFAVFDMDDICISSGWATYHMDVPDHPHISSPSPTPPDGHSPSNYARCACGVSLKWYDSGQHRYGSLAAGPRP